MNLIRNLVHVGKLYVQVNTSMLLLHIAGHFILLTILCFSLIDYVQLPDLSHILKLYIIMLV